MLLWLVSWLSKKTPALRALLLERHCGGGNQLWPWHPHQLHSRSESSNTKPRATDKTGYTGEGDFLFRKVRHDSDENGQNREEKHTQVQGAQCWQLEARSTCAHGTAGTAASPRRSYLVSLEVGSPARCKALLTAEAFHLTSHTQGIALDPHFLAPGTHYLYIWHIIFYNKSIRKMFISEANIPSNLRHTLSLTFISRFHHFWPRTASFVRQWWQWNRVCFLFLSLALAPPLLFFPPSFQKRFI